MKKQLFTKRNIVFRALSFVITAAFMLNSGPMGVYASLISKDHLRTINGQDEDTRDALKIDLNRSDRDGGTAVLKGFRSIDDLNKAILDNADLKDMIACADLNLPESKEGGYEMDRVEKLYNDIKKVKMVSAADNTGIQFIYVVTHFSRPNEKVKIGYDKKYDMTGVMKATEDFFKSQGLQLTWVKLSNAPTLKESIDLEDPKNAGIIEAQYKEYLETTGKEIDAAKKAAKPGEVIVFWDNNIRSLFVETLENKQLKKIGMPNLRADYEIGLAVRTGRKINEVAFLQAAGDKVHRPENGSVEMGKLFPKENAAVGDSVKETTDKVFRFQQWTKDGKVVAMYGGKKFDKLTTIIKHLKNKIAPSNGVGYILGALANALFPEGTLGASIRPSKDKDIKNIKNKVKPAVDELGETVKMPHDFIVKEVDKDGKVIKGAKARYVKDISEIQPNEAQIDIGKESLNELLETVRSLNKGQGFVMNGGTGVFTDPDGWHGTRELIKATVVAAMIKNVAILAAGADMRLALVKFENELRNPKSTLKQELEQALQEAYQQEFKEQKEFTIALGEKQTLTDLSEYFLWDTGGGALLTMLAVGVENMDGLKPYMVYETVEDAQQVASNAVNTDRGNDSGFTYDGGDLASSDIYVLSTMVSLPQGARTGRYTIEHAVLSGANGAIFNHSEARKELEDKMANLLGSIGGMARTDDSRQKAELIEKITQGLMAEGLSKQDARSIANSSIISRFLQDYPLTRNAVMSRQEGATRSLYEAQLEGYIENTSRKLVNKIINAQLKRIIGYSYLDNYKGVFKQTVLCVGETEKQYMAGKTLEVLNEDLNEILEGISEKQKNAIGLRVAYEPRWAIGTGRVPKIEEIQAAHRFIKETTAKMFKTEMEVDYGGSLNKKNAQEILSLKEVNGGLIGGAAKKPGEISPVIDTAIALFEQTGKRLNIGMNFKAENIATGLRSVQEFVDMFKTKDLTKVRIAISTPQVGEVRSELLRGDYRVMAEALNIPEQEFVQDYPAFRYASKMIYNNALAGKSFEKYIEENEKTLEKPGAIKTRTRVVFSSALVRYGGFDRVLSQSSRLNKGVQIGVFGENVKKLEALGMLRDKNILSDTDVSNLIADKGNTFVLLAPEEKALAEKLRSMGVKTMYSRGILTAEAAKLIEQALENELVTESFNRLIKKMAVEDRVISQQVFENKSNEIMAKIEAGRVFEFPEGLKPKAQTKGIEVASQRISQFLTRIGA